MLLHCALSLHRLSSCWQRHKKSRTLCWKSTTVSSTWSVWWCGGGAPCSCGAWRGDLLQWYAPAPLSPGFALLQPCVALLGLTAAWHGMSWFASAGGWLAACGSVRLNSSGKSLMSKHPRLPARYIQLHSQPCPLPKPFVSCNIAVHHLGGSLRCIAHSHAQGVCWGGLAKHRAHTYPPAFGNAMPTLAACSRKVVCCCCTHTAALIPCCTQ